MRYLVDFETRSDLSIDVGTRKYLNTPNSDIVCMGWKAWDDDMIWPVQLWKPQGMYKSKPPFVIMPEDRIYAHNMIGFDYEVWHTLGMRYNLPPFKWEQCVDSMALCGRYTYPQKLDFVGRVLRLKVQKDRKGKQLMNKICKPPFKYSDSDLFAFYSYCKTDVESMYHLIKAMPKDELEPSEQKIWVMTAKINQNGLPIDSKSIKRIYEVTEYYKKKRMSLVADLTSDAVKTVGQTAAIRAWCKEKGVILPNCQAETVQNFIDMDIDPDVIQLLKLRQELGATSTAKYKRLIEQDYYGRVYNNLRYYGAATGRWAGLGFQMHNLPRLKVPDPDAVISSFYDTTILKGKPVQAAKALIRPMIKAPKGKRLSVVDYSAIENVGLLWVAGEEDQLDRIRAGFDHYITFAASVYGVSYDDITPEQRFLGKTGVLGAGYNAAARAFLKFAKSYGLNMQFEQAEFVISTYRRDHQKVRKLWYELKDCSVAAVEHKGMEYSYNNCHFKSVQDRNGTTWLRVKIPSGRSLVYHSPEVKEDMFGPVVTHMGINSYTKQWSRLKLIPGRITENVIQALARDILAHGKSVLMDTGHKVVGSIHDEAICEIDEGSSSDYPQKMIDLMTELPLWCEDLPLKATGYVAKRYRKD